MESAASDVDWLLAYVTGLDRYAARAAVLTADQRERFEALVARRADREPLQHLLGTAAFRYRDLTVGPGVFVPRPETESLVDWAIAELAERAARGLTDPVVVDLGTGSGAIAGAVATEVPTSTVYAVERSEDALTYARRNLEGTGVDLRAGDLADCLPELDGRCDLVLANPPYIPLDAWESVAPEARDHDPALALWSGADGLDAIRAVAATAARLLKPGGSVGCEHADVQGESAPAVFTATAAFDLVRDRPDLAGRPRFVTARRASATMKP